MNLNRVLLFYISVNSGHQMAAMAIEEAIRVLDKSVETLNVNHFKYTNPVLAELIMRLYHSMLKRTPELWDYLYDNPGVKEKTAKLREMAHKSHDKKLHKLIGWYKPDIIVCTQAFPCVALAEYKRKHKIDIPIVGVITDYGVHSYWVDPDVDLYIVPTYEVQDRLIELGIKRNRINVIGIPISPKFYIPLDKNQIKLRLGVDSGKPVVLIMGGSRGMISMQEIVEYLAKLPMDFHIVIICGANKLLKRKLEKLKLRSKTPIKVFGYVANIEEYMTVSDIMVTKPGGLTVTEALAKNLPMVIVNPIPGQELKNTDYLIKNIAAIQASDSRDVARRVGEIISSKEQIEQLKQRMSCLHRPQAVFEIARRVIYWGK